MNIYQDNQSCFQPFFMPESHCDTNPKLFDAQEAIMLGNLFKELYMSYRGFMFGRHIFCDISDWITCCCKIGSCKWNTI